MATELDEGGFRAQVREIGGELVSRPRDRAESRAAIEALGGAGILAARWERRDDLFGVGLIEVLARLGLSEAAVGVSLHTESFLGILRQFAPAELSAVVEGGLTGTLVGCVAASEPGGGSDLAAVATTATRSGQRWKVVGEKKFVTMADDADYAVVLARLANTDGGRGDRLGAFLVPRAGYEVLKRHRLHAASRGSTAWIRVDATVPGHHLLGRPGLGLAVFNWGLTKERLGVVALVVGVCRLSLALATTHAMERHQFGTPLFEHQALRLRLAELDAQLHTLESDLRFLAGRAPDPRRIAGLKVTAARFGERCVSECMHIFGGDGYLEDATPLGSLWRDIRLARIGGGTDELMWEMVASGLKPDHDAYLRHITNARPERPDEDAVPAVSAGGGHNRKEG